MGDAEEGFEMPACKYCGQETGGSMFCQNCGAKVDAQPTVPQQVPVQPVMDPMQMIQPSIQQPYQNPMQPSYYTPRGAGGLLAGNIIVLVLSVIFFCGFFPLIAIPLSIIGIVFSVKAGRAKSPQEEKSNKTIALVMLIIGIFFLILGIIAFVATVYREYGGFDGFWEEIMNDSSRRSKKN